MMINPLIIKSAFKESLVKGRCIILFFTVSPFRFILISALLTVCMGSIRASVPQSLRPIKPTPLLVLNSSVIDSTATNTSSCDTLQPGRVSPLPHPIEEQATTTNAKTEADTLSNDTIYIDVELMPRYYGGIDSLMSYLGRNMIYPKWEFEQNIQGTVYVTFVVSSEGKIKESQIIKSVPESRNFDSEVLRVISAMPDWIPGEHEGKRVDVSFKLPITFRR
jgi:TonB family protein